MKCEQRGNKIKDSLQLWKTSSNLAFYTELDNLKYNFYYILSYYSVNLAARHYPLENIFIVLVETINLHE